MVARHLAANREQLARNLSALTRDINAFVATGDLRGWRDEAMLRRKYEEVCRLCAMTDAELTAELAARAARSTR